MADDPTRWEEFDVEELGRLMIRSNELEDWVGDLTLASSTHDEALFDARYHAHKLYRILSALAVQAEREYHEQQAASEA